MAIKDYKNIHEIVKETVDTFGNDTAFKWFDEASAVQSINWNDFYVQVRQVAKSLISLGVEKNDKVNVLSYSCYKWALSDIGITTAGGVTVGIYQTLLPHDCSYIINHSDAVVIFAENDEQVKKLLEIRKEIPNVRKVIQFFGKPEKNDWIIDYETFLQLGIDVPDSAVDERIAQTTSEDVASIVYTSGTTGVPKGAVITHDNLIFTSQTALECADARPKDEMFLFLPLAHVFARLILYGALNLGICTTFATSMDTIIDEIKIAKPDWFPSVPRIFEKVYSKVISGAETKGGTALKIFHWACEVGNQVSDLKLNRKPIPFLTGIKYSIANVLVFSKLQAALGGNLRWCVSGAAPLNANIAKFFHAADILIVEGIGMTENTSFTNVNRIDNFRFGWVGQPGPGIEQRIAEDGEVQFRGRNVMREYYKMPEETKETFTEDGWLMTGDLGEIDSEGFLRIVGRKKDLIITAGGKNVAPAPIESMIATSKYINQICIVGDKRKFLTALITLDIENIKEFAENEGITYENYEELLKNEAVNKLINSVMEEKNKDLPSYETIKKFTVVPEFTIENEMLTPTLKVKKNIVQKKYAAEIDDMYPKGMK